MMSTSGGTQHPTKEELRIFQTPNDVYDVGRLKSLGCLTNDLAIQQKKIQKCKENITLGMWNVRIMGKGKFNTVKDKIKIPHIDILGIRLRWTGIGDFYPEGHTFYY